ncbi:hypothetical protein M5K25_022150 [Dendrobium thyrsiflorum]|uniref:Uncharacterized protein n=2 Tax=Dendrobium thyrsiflorum TaxID=117978 RepID=A0ABD0U5V3_DENTH
MESCNPRGSIDEDSQFTPPKIKALGANSKDKMLLIVELLRMVGEWMMDPIKIPWFRRPGSSWSLVYLVRGGSRPNLTEGSLSAAMGFDAVGEHTGSGHDRNLVVPFGGKPPGSEGPES